MSPSDLDLRYGVQWEGSEVRGRVVRVPALSAAQTAADARTPCGALVRRVSGQRGGDAVAGEQRSTPHRTAGSDQGAATRVGRGKTRAAAVLCRPTRAGPGRAQGTYGRRQWTILRRRRIRSARNPSSRQDKALPPGSGAASSGERIHHCSRARTATSRITRARGRGRPNALITVVAHPAQAVDGGRAAGVAAARAFRPFNTPEPADAAPWVTELVTADAKRPPG